MRARLSERLLPFLAWPRPDGKTLARDLVAGLTVSLLAVPQSMAYAQLAGVPAYYGLYGAFLPTLIGALFGSSALLSTGPVALTSLLTAASVAQVATPGSATYFASVTLLALLSGVMQVALGLARAGVLLSLLSHPVLVGFINAAALVIILSQLPALTGISLAPTGSLLVDAARLFTHLDALHPTSTLLGALAMVMLLALKRLSPRFPGVLIMVVALTVLSRAIDFGAGGGQIVGTIPTGLPGLSMPSMDWTAAVALMPAAGVIALVSFTEAMSSCKLIALRTRTRWDENQELIGQGLAKVTAAFCQSMPVSGSFSRSALNLASHAHSGLSSVFAAGFVLLTLLFLTPLLFHLPKPALAAMIVVAVANLIDVKALRSAWRASRDDGVAAILTFAATLLFAPQIHNGILVGVLFSLGAFIYRRMVPRIVELGRHEDGSLHDLGAERVQPLGEHMAALRLDAALFFANVGYFEDAVLKIARDHPKVERILVVASGINHLDASAVEMLRALALHLRGHGISLEFCGVKTQVLGVMERTGLVDEIGRERFYASDASALAAPTTPVTSAG